MRKIFGIVFILFALFVVLAAISFRRNNVIPPLSGQVIAQTFQDWGRLRVSSTECDVVNNTWNRGAAGKSFEQSVLIEDVAGKQTAAWRWRVPFTFPPTVISQPQIICGNKPWDEKVRPDGGFPFQPGTKRLTANFDVSLRAKGTYNLAFTLWGISALPASKNVISHEIMIWADRKYLFPSGKRVDSITVNNMPYDVYIEENHGDASGKNPNKWTYVAFVPKQAQLHGPLDITAFTDYLLRRGTITSSHYLTSLELGNETGPGAGVTEIQNFGIEIKEPYSNEGKSGSSAPFRGVNPYTNETPPLASS